MPNVILDSMKEKKIMIKFKKDIQNNTKKTGYGKNFYQPFAGKDLGIIF